VSTDAGDVPTPVRLGAVGYLNARPLVHGLDIVPRFDVRYDVPSECARLLHAGAIDVGLIPSIEYLRGGPYRVAPDLAIASRGRVASVAIYTRIEPRDIRSIAMDTSSRTSVALATVLLQRVFGASPTAVPMAPDLDAMLAVADAALVIGDYALLLDHQSHQSAISNLQSPITKIDLGELWTSHTGLPFVWAFWAGRPVALDADELEALQRARNAGVTVPDVIARAYFPDSIAHQAVGARYLRDNIKYYLRDAERAGVETFYRYAAEAGLVARAAALRFYDVD
jgi:chorismate dehydratase